MRRNYCALKQEWGFLFIHLFIKTKNLKLNQHFGHQHILKKHLVKQYTYLFLIRHTVTDFHENIFKVSFIRDFAAVMVADDDLR